MTRGKFITLEGGEGTGKSTQIPLLCKSLEQAGFDIVATREPGGTPSAEEIRQLLVNGEPGRWQPLTEALLHSAARNEHVAELIRPALESGRWVVCDRFADSTMAYQGCVQGIGVEAVETLTQAVAADCLPDLTLILDLDPAQGLARAGSRSENGNEDRYERMGDDFHLKLRQAFLDIAAKEPQRCAVIDASGAPEDVQAIIWQTVCRHLDIES